MAKRAIEGEIESPGTTWYKLPEYKVMLVREGDVKSTTKIVRSPSDVVDVFRAYFSGLDREYFATCFLDRKGNLIGLNTVSIGTLYGSLVHPRETFKPAIIIGAASIILAHNHPSGDPTPSKDDIELTKRLGEAGKILSIGVMDHIIIGDGYSYYSFKEHGHSAECCLI